MTATGFKFEEALGDRGLVYRSTQGKVVILPSSKIFVDYEERLVNAVETLSRVLGEDRLRIAKAISSIGFDILKIRTAIGSGSYSLDLDEALDTLHGGYNLVDYSAVKATSQGLVKYVKGRRSKVVASYLDTVRMGQTEPGSFVLTLLLPTNSSSELVGLGEDAISLGQKVSQTLLESLIHSKKIVEEKNKKSAQISANFAYTLAEMVKRSPKIEIGVEQKSARVFKSVDFSRDDEDSLREIADYLAPRIETLNTTVAGTVINLSETRGQRSGTFIVETIIDDEIKNVRVPYDRSNRKQVIEAYDRKAEITISLHGNLIKSAGGRYTVEGPSGLILKRRGALA